jgi:hypothetical protein
VFCRQTGASEEHVFSKSLSKILPGSGDFTVVSGGDAPTKPRTAKVPTMVNRATCVTCNTGWMNDLEERGVPLLKDPVSGLSRDYSTMEQIALAAWAFKTACMCDCSWPGRVIPERHYRYVFRFRHPPPSVHIWLTTYNPGPDEPFHSARAVRAGHDVSQPGTPRSDRRFSYRFALCVGAMVFYLFSYVGADEEDYDPTYDVGTTLGGKPNTLRDIFHPLWPIYELNVSWPTRIGFRGTALDTFIRAMA